MLLFSGIKVHSVSGCATVLVLNSVCQCTQLLVALFSPGGSQVDMGIDHVLFILCISSVHGSKPADSKRAAWAQFQTPVSWSPNWVISWKALGENWAMTHSALWVPFLMPVACVAFLNSVFRLVTGHPYICMLKSHGTPILTSQCMPFARSVFSFSQGHCPPHQLSPYSGFLLHSLPDVCTSQRHWNISVFPLMSGI